MSEIPKRLATALSDRYPTQRQPGSGATAAVYLARTESRRVPNRKKIDNDPIQARPHRLTATRSP